MFSKKNEQPATEGHGHEATVTTQPYSTSSQSYNTSGLTPPSSPLPPTTSGSAAATARTGPQESASRAVQTPYDRAENLRLLFIIFLASAVEVIAAARHCSAVSSCRKKDLWAVIVGSVSVVMTFLMMAALYFMTVVNVVALEIAGVLLLAMWAAGTGILTFKHPFIAPGNGYFSSWVAFVVSLLFAYFQITLLRKWSNWLYVRTPLARAIQYAILILLVSSAVELAYAVVRCKRGSAGCSGDLAWAVSVGAISSFIALLGLFVPKLFQLHLGLSLLAVGLWIAGAGILTYDYSRWSTPGNGYFSTWFAFIASWTWLFLSLYAAYPRIIANRRRDDGRDAGTATNV